MTSSLQRRARHLFVAATAATCIATAAREARAQPAAAEPVTEAPTTDPPATDPPAADPPFARFWVGVAGSVDLAYLAPTADVCALGPTFHPANTRGYYCTNPDGTDFPSRRSRADAATLVRGRAGRLEAGPVAGDVRVLASFDYALRADLLVGIRAGVVLQGYSGSAAPRDGRAFAPPLHLELRGTYLLGDAPLAHSGFAPLLLADAGVAELDAGRTVQVRQSTVAGDRPKVAWRTGGPWFVGAGGGVRYAFSPRVAMTATARVAFAFDLGGVFPVLIPEMGVQYGF